MSQVMYPTGYVATPEVNLRPFRKMDIPLNQDGDDGVNKLFNAWQSKESLHSDRLEFARQAVLCFNRLVGHLPFFYGVQVNAHGTTDYRVKFLNDVLEFAETGVCKMQPINYILLIGEPVRDGRIVTPNASIKLPGALTTVKYRQNKFIAKWLSHDMGLDHFIQTLYVWFGNTVSKSDVGPKNL